MMMIGINRLSDFFGLNYLQSHVNEHEDRFVVMIEFVNISMIDRYHDGFHFVGF